MKEQALAFFCQPACAEILDFGVGFAVIASGLPTNTTSLVFTYTVAQVLTVVLLIYQLRRDLKPFPMRNGRPSYIGTACAMACRWHSATWPIGA